MTPYETSEKVSQVAAALVKAQAEVGGAAKSAKNPHFKSSFAPLDEVWAAAKEPLKANGLAVTQHPVNGENGTPGLRTVIWHESGEWIASTVLQTPDKAGPQALGSLITYLRRYSLQAVLGICPEDDDGEAATDHAEKPKRQAVRELTSKELEDFEASIHFAETKDQLDEIAFDMKKRGVAGEDRERLGAAWKARREQMVAEEAAS